MSTPEPEILNFEPRTLNTSFSLVTSFNNNRLILTSFTIKLTSGYEIFNFGASIFVRINRELMFRIFEPRSTLEMLQEKYSFLMRRSFEIALVDKSRSDLLNEKACKILKEIKRMEKDQQLKQA